MKLGIIGSNLYEKKANIKKIIWELKKKFNKDLIIVTTGQNNNTDKYVRDTCSLFDVKYEEVVRFDNKWSSYCVFQPYMYNKQKSHKWFFVNNENFSKYCDSFIIFRYKNDDTKLHLIENIKRKKEKKYVIFD